VIWFVEVQNKDNKVNVTTFDNDSDLGIFLQNYDRGKFRVVGIREMNIEKMSDSMDFVKKDENLEHGKKEEK